MILYKYIPTRYSLVGMLFCFVKNKGERTTHHHRKRWSQPSCGTQNRWSLLFVANDFDHCANSHSLHPPPAAVVFLAPYSAELNRDEKLSHHFNFCEALLIANCYLLTATCEAPASGICAYIFLPPLRTKIVSSPITTISFQQTIISSPLPKKPHTPLPQNTVMLTIQPVQVSISTSVTQPNLQPLSMLTTSFALKSVTVHFKAPTPILPTALFFGIFLQNFLLIKGFCPCLFL